MKILLLLIPLCGIGLGVKLKNIDVTFHVYDLEKNSSITPDFKLDFSWKTDVKSIILIHGMIKQAAFQSSLMDVFFSAKQNFNGNIITVDWKKGVAEWSDHELIKNTEFTGKRVKDLIEHFKDNLSDIEIIGHGIGAHVAGIGARDSTVQKITALDPAGHIFENSALKLRNTDADYVEVFHSNGFFHGHHEPLGDVDIYLNKGEVQPGCHKLNEDFGECSHEYAFKFFAHSLQSVIKGVRCASLGKLRSGECGSDQKEMFGPNPLQCRSIHCLYYIDTTIDQNIPFSGASRESKDYNLPEFNAVTDIKVQKYQPDNQNIGIYLKNNWNEMLNTLDKTGPTYILIHGIAGSEVHSSMANGLFKYHDKEKANVIGINWENGANLLNTEMVHRRVPAVGEYVAKLIKNIKDSINMGKLSVIGHDVGAHCAGVAGKFLNQKYDDITINQIIGLDPLGIGFYEEGSKMRRLSEGDADNVEIYHTNAGGLGYKDRLGKHDFYVNNGQHQPKCKDWKRFEDKLEKKGYFNRFFDHAFNQTEATNWVTDLFDFTESTEDRICNHKFAYKYVAQAYGTKKIKNLKCHICWGNVEDTLRGTCLPQSVDFSSDKDLQRRSWPGQLITNESDNYFDLE